MSYAAVADAVMDVVEVMHHGDEKHGLSDWLKNPQAWSEHVAAARRHLDRWEKGQVDESGFSHLAHAASRLLILAQLERQKLGKDDRR